MLQDSDLDSLRIHLLQSDLLPHECSLVRISSTKNLHGISSFTTCHSTFAKAKHCNISVIPVVVVPSKAQIKIIKRKLIIFINDIKPTQISQMKEENERVNLAYSSELIEIKIKNVRLK
jgi:hypothetical protein